MTATAAQLAALLPGDDCDRGARNWLETHGMPDPRDESWRYTPLGEILSALAAAESARPEPADTALVDRLAGDHGGPRVVFVNGYHVAGLSRAGSHVPGLRLGEIDNGIAGLDGMLRVDGFQALNRAAGRERARVTIDAGVEADEPVHVVHLALPAPHLTVSHARTVISAGDASRLTVIETFAGLGGAMITNASTIITVGDGAQVTYQRIQSEGGEAVHVGHTRVEQGAQSHLRSSSIMLGADIARHAIDVTVRGPGATTELRGLYAPTGRQRHDTIATVDHAASSCSSTQQFQGVMAGKAHGSFGGRIIVRAGTAGIDARQTNQNLLLDPSAQADTRPWLEIFADDVRCTHGATVGRLDDEAMFYLRSRGIAPDDARSMLVDAFVGEITGSLVPASLRDRVAAAIAGAIAPTGTRSGGLV